MDRSLPERQAMVASGAALAQAGRMTQNDGELDVVVIGGGAAGSARASTLARARRSVLVIDAGEPRNAPADGVHDFLSRDGMPPPELVATRPRGGAAYGGAVVDGRGRRRPRRAGDGFVVTAGRRVDRSRARRLLVTTGLVDELPDIPGLRERWGRDVLHCPYCHGWEVRDQAVGVLATSADGGAPGAAVPAVSRRRRLVRHTAPDPTPEQAEQLAREVSGWCPDPWPRWSPPRPARRRPARVGRGDGALRADRDAAVRRAPRRPRRSRAGRRAAPDGRR